MKRITQVAAIIAALSAFPALAEEGAPVPGSNKDPFSQTYTGKDEPQKVERCGRSCSCAQHQGAQSAAQKADSPRFTDAG